MMAECDKPGNVSSSTRMTFTRKQPCLQTVNGHLCGIWGGAFAFTANPVGVGMRQLTLKGQSPSPGFRAADSVCAIGGRVCLPAIACCRHPTPVAIVVSPSPGGPPPNAVLFVRSFVCHALASDHGHGWIPVETWPSQLTMVSCAGRLQAQGRETCPAVAQQS